MLTPYSLLSIKVKSAIHDTFCKEHFTDNRTDVWSRPSCIYTQIFSPKKTGLFTFSGSNFYFLFNFVKNVSCMQLFSADAIVFSKKKFLTLKNEKNRPRPFYSTVQSSPSQTTTHSPELIFHIMKSWDQTSVLLSGP